VARQHFASAAGPRAALAPAGGRPADVIELIMADHRRIRRLSEALYDAVRCAGDLDENWMLAHVWQRLSGLLEAHTRAEEEVCYPVMLRSGAQADELRRGAIADHDDIREAVAEASLRRVGSALWWRAVRAVLDCTAEHLEREERGVLARCELTAGQRRELGRQWSAFVAAWIQDAAPQAARSSRPGPGAEPSSPGALGRRIGALPGAVARLQVGGL
jgi:hypothetical protein